MRGLADLLSFQNEVSLKSITSGRFVNNFNTQGYTSFATVYHLIIVSGIGGKAF